MSGAVILFALFFILIIIGVPIGYSIGISALAAFLSSGINPTVFITSSLAGSNSFTLMAVPFFMLAGSLMATGGIAKRIVNFVNSFFGYVTGGLAIVTTVACMFFGAISGSAVATTSAIGSFMIPEMEKHGYNKDFAATLRPPRVQWASLSRRRSPLLFTLSRSTARLRICLSRESCRAL